MLNFLATQSPQAAHYYEILTLLANAIAKQREKIASKGRSRYVSRLFTFDGGDADGRADAATGADGGERGAEWVPGGAAAAADYTAELGEEGVSWMSGSRTPAGGEEVFLGWDSLDISQWDSFPFIP